MLLQCDGKIPLFFRRTSSFIPLSSKDTVAAAAG